MNITKSVEFESGCIFQGCFEAHRYKFEVTVVCPQREIDSGVVIEFDKLSQYLESVVPDNSFIHCFRDPVSSKIYKVFNECGMKTYIMDSIVSCENLCKNLVSNLQSILNVREPGVVVMSARLRENPNSFVSWKRESL